jgi:hypothetical protein
MFDCDRIIAAQAVTWMDPNNEGVDFATFKKYIQVYLFPEYILSMQWPNQIHAGPTRTIWEISFRIIFFLQQNIEE